MNILELDNEIKEVLQEQEGLPWGTNQCLLYKAQIMLRTIPALEAEIAQLKHINQNWQIAGKMDADEIEALKAKIKYLESHEYMYEAHKAVEILKEQK